MGHKPTKECRLVCPVCGAGYTYTAERHRAAMAENLMGYLGMVAARKGAKEMKRKGP